MDFEQKIMAPAIQFSQLNEVLYCFQGKAPGVLCSLYLCSQAFWIKGFCPNLFNLKMGFKAPNPKSITEV